jgi:hypothetical protein
MYTRGAMERRTLLLAVILCGATLAPVWSLDYFPGQDTANHLYAVHARNRIEQPPFADTFIPENRARTNLTFHLFVQALERPLGLEGAHRLFLSLYVVCFFAGALYLAGATGRERQHLALLCAPFALNWFVTMGFYNFCVTIPLFAFALGIVLRHPEPRARHLTWLALLAILLVASHPLGVLCTGVAVIVAVSSWAARLRVAAAFIPAALFAATGESGLTAYDWEWPDSFKSPLFAVATGFYRFALPFGASEWPTATPAYALLFLPAVWTSIVVLRRRWRGEPTERLGPASRVAAALLPLWLLLPEFIFHNFFIFHRVVPYIALTVPLWASYRFLFMRPRLLTTILLVLGLGSTALFWRSASAINHEIAEYTAGLSAVERGKSLLPLNFDPKIDRSRVVEPTLHAWGYYAVARDLVVPYLFNADKKVPRSLIAFKKEWPTPPAPAEHTPRIIEESWICDAARKDFGKKVDCAPFTELAYATLMRQAKAYDYVLTWRAPPDLPARLAASFDPIFERGRLRIYRRKVENTSARPARP